MWFLLHGGHRLAQVGVAGGGGNHVQFQPPHPGHVQAAHRLHVAKRAYGLGKQNNLGHPIGTDARGPRGGIGTCLQQPAIRRRHLAITDDLKRRVQPPGTQRDEEVKRVVGQHRR